MNDRVTYGPSTERQQHRTNGSGGSNFDPEQIPPQMGYQNVPTHAQDSEGQVPARSETHSGCRASNSDPLNSRSETPVLNSGMDGSRGSNFHPGQIPTQIWGQNVPNDVRNSLAQAPDRWDTVGGYRTPNSDPQNPVSTERGDNRVSFDSRVRQLGTSGGQNPQYRTQTSQGDAMGSYRFDPYTGEPIQGHQGVVTPALQNCSRCLLLIR